MVFAVRFVMLDNCSIFLPLVLYHFWGVRKKLKGYNEGFSDTVRFIPASDTKLIPDFYHTILHILILINIVLIFLQR